MKKISFSMMVVPFVLLTCLTSVVQATPVYNYNYTYTWFSGATLTGMLEGTLQPDGNTVHVTNIMGSYAGANPAFDLANTGAFAFPSGPGIVTLDGTFFNLFQGTALFVNTEFFIDTSSGGARLWHPFSPAFTFLVEDDGISPTLNGWVAAEHWSITEKTVPAPATLALFGLGLAGLGWSRRKA